MCRIDLRTAPPVCCLQRAIGADREGKNLAGWRRSEFGGRVARLIVEHVNHAGAMTIAVPCEMFSGCELFWFIVNCPLVEL